MPGVLIQTSPALRTDDSGASSPLSFDSAITAGSKLILCVGNYPSGIASIADNRGNNWQQAISVGDGGENFVEYWWADNAAAGATTLTITPISTSGNFLSGRAQEWSGLGAGAPERTGTASGFGNTTVSTSEATTTANSLVMAAAISDEGNDDYGYGVPTGFTQIDVQQNSNTNTGYNSVYRLVTETGVQSCAFTLNNFSVDAVIVTWPEATGSNAVNPDAGSVAITGHAPTVERTDHHTVAPGAAQVTVSGQLPLVAVSDHRVAQPGAGTLVLQGHQPQAQISDHRTASPAAAALVLTGHEPILERSEHHIVQPGAGGVAITGLQPTVHTGDGHHAEPSAGTVVLSGHVPTAQVSDHHTSQPAAAQVTVSGHAPTILSSDSATPGTGLVVISGHAPTATASANVLAAPGPGEIVITGYAPQILAAISAHPGAGTVTIEGRAPTLRVQPIKPPKPAVNLLDPKYFGKKRRNVRFKPAVDDKPAPVVVAPTQQQPSAAPLPKGSRLLQSLLERANEARIALSRQAVAPPAQAKPKAPTSAQAPAPVAEAPAAAPYASDLDPFYEPPRSDLAELEARMQAQVHELEQQLAAVRDELQQLKQQPYQSDLDPFYDPEPLQQLAGDVRAKVRRENRRRAELMVRKLFD